MNVPKNISIPLDYIFKIKELVDDRYYDSFSAFVQEAIEAKFDKVGVNYKKRNKVYKHRESG